MIVDFPPLAARRAAKRLASSRPRRSKNGTPEERAAKAALAPTVGDPRVIKRRRSKNGTPEERAARRTSANVVRFEAAWAKLAAAPAIHRA